MNFLSGSDKSLKLRLRLCNTLKCYFLIITALALFAETLEAYPLAKNNALELKKIHWTGFYAGGTFGSAWEKNNATWRPLPSPTYFGADQVTRNNRGQGALGGILAGFNYQLMRTSIVGVEGDWSWSNITGSFISAPWTIDNAVDSPASYTSMKSTLHWIPSLRGRIGYLVFPQVMIFGAAGVAWANSTYTANNSNGFEDALFYTTNTSFSKTSIGYTVGGGIEWAIVSNFFVRAEYLYYQFNNTHSTVAQVIAQDLTGNFPEYPSNYAWKNTTVNIARAGLVYKFDGI